MLAISVGVGHAQNALTHEDMIATKRLGDVAVSPDGRWVAMQIQEFSYSRPGPSADIWIAPIDGSTSPRRLTAIDGVSSAPAWSPDGSRIAFSATVSEGPAQLFGARALAELRMHSNEMTLDEAAEYIVDNTPYDWLTLDGNTVWREGQLYLEQPSYGTSYVIGKIHLDRLLSDRRRQLGVDFTLRTFMDDLHSSGMIPLSLIRWEMTGLDDEMRQLQ